MATKPKIVTLTNSSVDILNVIRNNASYAYQKDVPKIEQEQDIPKVGEILFGNPTHSNEFINALINRIALVRMQSATFNNPYAILKKGYLEFGESIEDIFVSIDNVKEFKITENAILLTDFANTHYKLDFNGNLIK